MPELTEQDQMELEAWYVETRDRNWAEEEEEWTAESYALAAQQAHLADKAGVSA